MKKVYVTIFCRNSRTNGSGIKIAGCQIIPPRYICFFFLVCSLGFSNTSLSQPGAGWIFSRPVTISPATTLANYQVKVTLTTAIMGNPYTNINASGSDLRFYDNNNISCPYWIESFDNTGTSVIWVKVATTGSASLTMYYGNAAATPATNGSATFDFFDDFTAALGANWSVNAGGGSVIQSGTNVTLSNTSTGSVSISSAFTPASSSFFLETKHAETGYNRNRFYAATVLNGSSPTFDYGYFSNQSTSQTTSKIFWNGGFSSATPLNNGTDYLTRWQLTDGSTYNWYTFNYATGAALDGVARNTTLATNVRAITIKVNEVSATSIIVDWVRVRKSQATDPTTSVGAQGIIPVLTSLGASAGCVGNTITIDGTNLTGATSVTIGGISVTSITTNTATQIVAVIGGGNTGNVVVRTAAGVSNGLSFTVNSAPTVTNPILTQTICSGGSTTTVTLTGSIAGTTFAWTTTATTGVSGFIASGTGPIPMQAIFTTGTTQGTVTYAVTPTATGCPGAITNYTVLVNPSPVVSAGGTVTAICNGGLTAALGGSFGGGATAALWSDGGAGGSFANNTGSTPGTATYTSLLSGPATVTLTLTTSGGLCGATSDSKILTVNPLPTATVSGTASACLNDVSPNITFTGAGGTAPYTFNYTLNGNPLSVVTTSGNSVLVPAATGTTGIFTYSLVSVRDASSTACSQSQTGSAVITINNPVVITAQPAPATQTICASFAATFTVAASGDITGYQWYLGATPLTDNTNISGSQTAVLKIDQVTSSDAGLYHVVVKGATPCPDVTSANATLLVNQDIIINTQPSPQAVCLGNTATFSVIATGTGLTYQWRKNGINLTDAGNISGSLSNTLSVSNVAPADVANYSVVASDGVSGCPNANSANAALSINPTPVLSSSLTPPSRCNNVSATYTALSATGGTAFTWTRALVTGISNAAGSGSGATITETLINTTTDPVNVVYVIALTANGCNNTQNVTVTVNPTPTLSSSLTPPSRCNNVSATYTATSATIGAAFTWTRAVVGGISNSAGSGNSGTITETLINTTANAVNVTYLITVTVNGCSNVQNVTITVSPTPTLTSSLTPPAVCTNTVFSYSAASATAGTTFNWSRAAVAGISNVAASGTNNPNETLINTTTTSINVTYVYTLGANGCNNTQNVVVSVNPDATISLSSAAATASQTKCINTGITNITYAIGGSGTGATVTGLPAGLITGFSGGTFTISGAPTVPGTFNYTVTVAGPCIKPALSGTITVTPNSTIGLTSPAGTDAQTVCTNMSITNITYAIGGTGTNASITSGVLPAGVTGSFSAGVFTIAGTPTVAGNYNYTVTPTGPCLNPSLGGTISVSPIPTGTFAATENSGTPNNNSICTGSAVTFTLNPSGYGSYIFKVGGVTVQSGASNIYSSSALTNGASVTVDVANSSNCGITFGPVVIAVSPLPVPTISASKTSVCPGDNITFTASSGYANYNFKINNSSIQSGVSNVYSTTTLNNNDKVTVDVTNASGCIGTSNQVLITVNPVPSGTLTTTATSICTGNSVTFTALPAGFANYNFKVNSTSIQSGTLNTFTYTPVTSPSVVTVDVSNATGCTASFAPVVININPSPTGSVVPTENSGTANDNNICAGANVTFTATTGFSDYKFYLKGTGAVLQAGSSNSYNSTTLVNGDYITVVVTGAGSCQATFTSVVITVVPLPGGTLSVSPSASICAGSNVTFTASPIPSATYLFKLNGTTILQNGSSNIFSTSALVNDDVVTVDVSSNSCTATFNAITMVVKASPTGTLVPVENSGNVPDDGIICTGTNVVFTAPAGFADYNFIFNGISVQTGPGNTYSNNSLATNDKVEVAVTNGGGCIGLLNPVIITVNTLPAVAPITGAGNVCLNNSITLSDVTAGGSWASLDMTIVTVDASGVVTGVAPGTATINYTFTNTNGCSTTVSTTVTVNTPPTVTPITGNFNICTGNSSPLNNATTGGSWTSGNTAVATVDATGVVTAITPGTSPITYTVTDGSGCATVVTADITVNDLPVVAQITTTAPFFNACVSGQITLADATTGGAWSSSNTAVATINSSGVVTGLSSGTSVIDYTITTSCLQTAAASVTITVNGPPSATIAYTGGPFCTTSGTITVSQTGTPGGTYSTTAGLTINSADGTITPATSTGGTYTVTYTIAASGGCGVYTTTTPVTITTAPSATIAYPGSQFCSSSVPVSVTRTGTAGGTYSSAAGLTINASTGTITPATSTNGAYSVIYTIAASGGCAQFTTNTSVTINIAPSATIAYAGGSFCVNSAPVNVTRTGTAGGTYTSAAGLTLDGASGTITPGTSTGGTYTVTYSITASGGCAAFTTTASVTITAAPTAVAGTAILTCANSAPVDITTGAGATNQSSVLWTSSGTAGTITNANSLTGATYAPSAADKAAGSITLTLTANGNVGCAAVTSSKNVTISPLPAPPTITPATAAICQGSILPLSSGISPSTGSVTFSSGSVALAIPDYPSAAGAASTIAVSGIPAGAVVNSVSIMFNITHTWDSDLKINLKAPNNNVLNLVNSEGGSGHNFTNTIISSDGVTSLIGAAASSAPFTNTYQADALNSITGATIVPGNISNVTSFASLFGIANGNWIFSAVDAGEGDIGTIDNWSVTINYTTAAVPEAVVWSPLTDLYTDPGATTPYAGQSLATVYAKPATAGTKVYTANALNAATCTSASTTTLTVNASPAVTILADYCAVAGKVRLTASSTPAGATYVWSTTQTGAVIDVDIAAIYYVVASYGTGCSATGSVSVAQELVVNGNFTGGNTGFTSDYAYKPDVPGLVPAGQGELFDDTGTNGYSISNSGQNVHADFWGQDHTANTTGSRNFMMVNGHGNSLVIWKETVNVLPNTTYYFSAWAMSLNPAGNNAQLQFSVNGTSVGTTAILADHCRNCTTGNSNDNWTRFYGTWTSGPTTTSASIFINDLQSASGGNDFGLDDVSFGTLSTFVSLQSAPGTDAQTPCINTALTPIVYSVGSSAFEPTITPALPAGVTSSFNGTLLTISGTPTVAGDYTYTVTTTGTCVPSSASGTISVGIQKITLSSGNASPSFCVNTPINIGFTLGGTAANATITGLPAGISGSLSGTTYTISGTSGLSGVYPYTITTSGTCSADTFNGTITLQTQTITLSSVNATQTVCINTPITNIQYTVGSTVTGASVTGLPPGVTGIYNSGLFIISGTPTNAAGSPFTYTVTTSGSCSQATTSGTITVTPTAGFTLTSGAATNPQTACINTAINNIIYAVNGGTNATASGLPPGINGVFNSGIFTISGIPTVSGIFNYTIATTGGCGTGTATGTITVQAQTISLTSGIGSPSLCANTPMTNIVYTIGGTAVTAAVTGLPSGVTGLLSGNVFTISGTPTAVAGPYPYTITTSGGCGQTTATGTITITPAPAGGVLTSVLICSGSSGVLTLSAYSGTIQGWETSTDGGLTWSALAPNTTISQVYNNIIQPTMYRVVVNRAGCNITYSTLGTISIRNLWTGVTNTDWNTASNWSGNVLPSISCPDVYIPSGTPHQPTLNSGPTATINNLHIFPGATLTINGGTLQIAGTITNDGTFIAANGSIELNGSSPQTIPSGVFQNNALNNLVIGNSNTIGVTIGGALDIYGSLTYTAAGKNLNTSDILTLKSTSTGTASIGNMTGHTINGDVTVERYIATGTTHAKSWQLLAVPTQGQTIKASWQEGASATNVLFHAPGSAGNPVAGYGTMLTSDVAGATNQLTPGFDAFTSPGPSIKVYNTLTDGYNGPASTGMQVYNQKGYFILVRGDRSVYTSAGFANPTVLRTKGVLFTPANPPPSTTVLAGKLESVGNPYASAIDLRQLTLDAGVNSTIIVWDPTLGIGSAFGLGAYQTLYLNGNGTNNGINNYLNLLPSTAYGPAGTINNNIQSGQGFIIQALPAVNGNLSFTESAKSSGSKLLFRPQAPIEEKQPQLRTNLYGISASGSSTFIDGTLIQYNDNYNSSIDGMDARKMVNIGENLAIKTAGRLLAIERRHTITQQDTIFLNLSGENLQAYRFEFIAGNLNTGLKGFLEDNYLQTRTALDLNGTSVVNFTVANIAGSYARDRFRIVFVPAVVLPVTFTSVKAYRQDKYINVEWKVENEMNIKQYEVEKSINGTLFSTLIVKKASVNGGNSAIYVTEDTNPMEGYNYYRVKSVDINGKSAYSNVVKVLMGSVRNDITIYPNPITDGMIHLQLINQREGRYGIRLLNKLGQVITSRQINHTEGSSTELIKWDYNLAHGMYQLEVTKPGGGIKNINVIY